MRWPSCLLPLFLGGILPSQAQESEIALTNSFLTLDGTLTGDSAQLPTGDYQTYSSTVTLSSDGAISSATVTGSGSAMATASSSGNDSYTTTTSDSLTVLVGGMQTSIIGNASANATSSAGASSTATPVNTQPCNSYPEFCTRKYSNITMVAAHNSPFVKQGNVAANQVLDVESQLNDGIRMRRSCPFSLGDKKAELIECSAIPNPFSQRHPVSLPQQL